MTISALFIQRPIATTLLAVGLTIAGIVAFNLLPVSALPQIEFPVIAVQASLPGANAEVMAASVTTPLETKLSRIAGVNQMTSSSSSESSQISLRFDLSRDINGAASDVQAAINAALSQLPTNLPNNPTYRKYNPADSPILILSLTSDKYTVGEIFDSAFTVLRQKLSQIDGVGHVKVGGSSLPAIRVELNPTVLNHLGINLTTVADVIKAANPNIAKGQINNEKTTSTILTNDQIFEPSQYSSLIIAYRNGNPVRIADVGEVVESVEDLRVIGRVNDKPAVFISLFKQSGANIIEIADRVRALLPHLQASIPKGINLNVIIDRTLFIRHSLHSIEITLFVAMVLVILVTGFFLANTRAMIISGVAVPLSLLGTLGVMSLLKFSLNNVSLMALTLSTGFVIDDAVVMLENIMRHIEMGKKPFEAALIGSREVTFTIISISLSLIAVFIPLLLMGDISGRLFREFSVTLTVAILISLIVSLTLTPMMCAHLLKAASEKKENWYTRFNHRIRKIYELSLGWSLNHAGLMLFVILATIACNILLFIVIPKNYIPQQDTGYINGSLVADQHISFEALKNKFLTYLDIIRHDPAVKNVVGSAAGTKGEFFILLKDLDIRKVSSETVINRLRAPFRKVTGASLYLQSVGFLPLGGGRGKYQYTLSADNLQILNVYTRLVKEKLINLSGITDVSTDQADRGLQIFVNVDRDTASRLGFSTKQINATLYSAFGQSQVSTMYLTRNQFHVIMEAAPKYWQSPSTLKEFYLTSANNDVVPLSAFARFAPSSMLRLIQHRAQAPTATLSFNLLPGVPLSDALNRIDQAVTAMNLPETINGSFQGIAKNFRDLLAKEAYLIIGALLTVYIVLGILYESLIHPITIISTLPAAGIGALVALMVTRTEFSIFGLIGIILLIGIVKKNAIMMIDFALDAQRNQNKSPRDAIYEAALLRFRPIIMTTMAALLGALPLMLDFSIGSEMRRPLGIVIVGGLIVSQLLNLFTTPVLYLYIEQLKKSTPNKRATL